MTPSRMKSWRAIELAINSIAQDPQTALSKARFAQGSLMLERNWKVFVASWSRLLDQFFSSNRRADKPTPSDVPGSWSLDPPGA